MTNQTELEQMSDAELNMTLAELRYPNSTALGFNDMTKEVYVGAYTLNYCNIPNDIYPIQFELGIDLMSNYDRDKWAAEWDRETYIYSEHTNPLRAIVIVAILVLMEKR